MLPGLQDEINLSPNFFWSCCVFIVIVRNLASTESGPRSMGHFMQDLTMVLGRTVGGFWNLGMGKQFTVQNLIGCPGSLEDNTVGRSSEFGVQACDVSEGNKDSLVAS